MRLREREISLLCSALCCLRRHRLLQSRKLARASEIGRIAGRKTCEGREGTRNHFYDRPRARARPLPCSLFQQPLA